MKPFTSLFLALSLSGVVRAQDDIPLLIPEERSAVEAQAEAFNDAISPVLADAAKSTVRIWAGSRRLAYGTVVGNGSQVLTKWSEIARVSVTEDLRVGTNRDYRPVRLGGIYQEEDLAVLEIEGDPLVPVKWSEATPALGSFIAAPQPDGRLAAFGVVSVLERNLRDTDMAYLGVFGDAKYHGPGVRVEDVAEDSGAAKAGLKTGDIILKVGDRAISGVLELKNSLIGVAPGSSVALQVKNGDGTMIIDVILGNRPDLPQFSGDRLRLMERMGGPISEVRDSFSHAIQTDMRPKPNQIGGPVVDLKGNVLGITMARADRTRSFVMPAAAVKALLEKPASEPLVANATVESPDERPAPQMRGMSRPPRGKVITEERMRRHISDMRRLMDHMRDEMEALEALEQP
ncbi:MAG: PDZ domain-containing protein [Verrucomicrobiaceae bacterium]|nr:MAG: PDZ domain-containing protein [Verrucomicrobiaceae bacterium]